MVYWVFFYQIGIIALVIFVTFRMIFDNKLKTYSDFIDYLVNNNKVLSYSINNIINIFLLISFIVMVAGFGAYFMQEFNIPAYIGSCLIAILAFFTFFKSIDGIVRINSYLIPILIFLIFLLGIKSNIYNFNPHYLNNYSNFSWIIKSILYASYNSIVLIPIIISLQNLATSKKQIKCISLITLFIMLTISIIIYIVLSLNFNEIANLEIPIVYIASKFGIIYKYLYGLIILIAIFTTAISEGYSFLNNISKSKKQYLIYSIFICTLSICFSNIGFGKLLDILYPILGYLGLIQIILLCMQTKKL